MSVGAFQAQTVTTNRPQASSGTINACTQQLVSENNSFRKQTLVETNNFFTKISQAPMLNEILKVNEVK